MSGMVRAGGGCVIDPYSLPCNDIYVQVSPLQSDALSGALHPTPAKHGSEVLRPRTQDCSRKPVKQADACQIHPPFNISLVICWHWVYLSGFEVTSKTDINYTVFFYIFFISGDCIFILSDLIVMLLIWKLQYRTLLFYWMDMIENIITIKYIHTLPS